MPAQPDDAVIDRRLRRLGPSARRQTPTRLPGADAPLRDRAADLDLTEHPVNHHVADPEPPGVEDRDQAGRPRAPDPHQASSLDRGQCSEPERLRHLPCELVRGHRGVDVDDGKFEALRLLDETLGEHPVALEQVA